MGLIKKNNKKSETEKIKKIDKKVFARIKDKFREYWKILFRLIFIYIVCYLIWLYSSKHVRQFAHDKKLNGDALFLVICLALFQGILFTLDGFVTALLKSPFNQMCYAINKAEGISDKQKDYIISKATRSNEDCKETLKKFGIITMVGELAKVFINREKFDKNTTDYEHLIVISYLVPLISAAWSIWSIHQELKKIEKSIKKYQNLQTSKR